VFLDSQGSQAGEITAIPAEMSVRVSEAWHNGSAISLEESNIWTLEQLFLVRNFTDCFESLA
jgi:hypothetical protein